jgi:hypothetical protein
MVRAAVTTHVEVICALTGADVTLIGAAGLGPPVGHALVSLNGL